MGVDHRNGPRLPVATHRHDGNTKLRTHRQAHGQGSTGRTEMRIPTRKDDDLIIRMLQMNDDGMGQTQIAQQLGLTKGTVIGAIHRIRPYLEDEA